MTDTVTIWERARFAWWAALPEWLRLRVPLRVAAETVAGRDAIAAAGAATGPSGHAWDDARTAFWRRLPRAAQDLVPARYIAARETDAAAIVGAGGVRLPPNDSPHDVVAEHLPAIPDQPARFHTRTTTIANSDQRWPTSLVDTANVGIQWLTVAPDNAASGDLLVGQRPRGRNDPGDDLPTTPVTTTQQAYVTGNDPLWARYATAPGRVTIEKVQEA